MSKIRRIRYVESNQPPVASAVGQPDLGTGAAGRELLERRLARSRRPAADVRVDVRRRRDVDRRQPVAHLRRSPASTRRGSTVSDGVNTHPLDADRPSASAASRRRRSCRRQDGSVLPGRRRDLLQRRRHRHRGRHASRPARSPGTSTSSTKATCIPGVPKTGVKSGSFTIPTSGHDFSGNTRYRITLTVTDSDGLTSTQGRSPSGPRR